MCGLFSPKVIRAEAVKWLTEGGLCVATETCFTAIAVVREEVNATCCGDGQMSVLSLAL